MGWRPSDRNGAVIMALLRLGKPVCVSALVELIQADDQLREWWFELATPGQKHYRIQLSGQNVENRLRSIAKGDSFVVVGETGTCSVRGYENITVWRVLPKADRAKYLAEWRAQYAIPADLAAELREEAAQLGIGVKFWVAREGSYGRAWSVLYVRAGTGRGSTLGKVWHHTGVAAAGKLREAWVDAAAQAGLR